MKWLTTSKESAGWMKRPTNERNKCHNDWIKDEMDHIMNLMVVIAWIPLFFLLLPVQAAGLKIEGDEWLNLFFQSSAVCGHTQQFPVDS